MSILVFIFLWIILYIGFSSFFKLCKSYNEWKKLSPQEKDRYIHKKEKEKAECERYQSIEAEGFRKYPSAGHYYKRKEYIRKRCQEEGL